MINTSISLPKRQPEKDVLAFPGSPASRKTQAAAEQNQDAEFSCDATIPVFVPAGKYDVVFLRAEKKVMWGREKVFLWFQIVTPGDFHGTSLWMACNGPRNGKVGASSKFYSAWVLAAGKRPDRFDRMSTRIFRGKVFLAQIRVVTHNSKGHALPDFLQYSTIDDLLEC